MLSTARGSINGYEVTYFNKGIEYDLPTDLAKSFIGTGEAEQVVAPAVKDAGAAPSNKSMSGAPANKGASERKG